MTAVLKEREWKHKWETVHMDDNCSLDRMRVPGGWLYKTENWSDGFTTAMCFVPRYLPEEENY